MVLYHKDIFYPSQEESLTALTKVCNSFNDSQILLFPHARMEIVSPLIRSTLCHGIRGKRIVFLSPVHTKDIAEGLYTLPEDENITPFPSAMIDPQRFEDEYPFEMTYQFLHRWNEEAILVPVLVNLSTRTSIHALSQVLSTFISDGDTIAISSNFSLSGKSSTKEAELLCILMEEGAPLLDPWKKGLIKGCGIPIIEAVRPLAGIWHFTGFKSGNYLGASIKSNDNNTIWYAGAYKA